MFPNLFSIGPVIIHTYGLFIAMGFTAALLVTIKIGKAQGIKSQQVMDMGFIMMPDAIPVTKPPEPPGPGPFPPGPEPPGLEPPGPEPTPPELQKTVNITFAADRDQLYNAWQAIANLADMAGTVNVNVQAESEEGFDKNKLRNAVIEPLQEADLID